MSNPKAVSSPVQLIAFLFLLLAIFPHLIQSSKSPRAFEFLQHLEGCQKGQTVKGLNELKLYLKKFGYINRINNDLKPTNDENGNNDDEFDELLESAIKTYQLNYRLKPTGSLDAQTVNQMMMPRCGVPDINVNGTTLMRSGKKKHHEQSGSFHTVLHYKIYNRNLKWPLPSKTQLTYRFSSSVPVNVDMGTLRSVCSRAFARWSAVTQFTFTEVAGDQSDIVIGFHRGDHGDGGTGNNFDGHGGTTAHAFPPTDGRFHYDADEDWSDNPGPNMMDLESIAVHEIGHLLGLDHSSDPNAVMFSTLNYGVRKRDLQGDDVDGIRALYGFSK